VQQAASKQAEVKLSAKAHHHPPRPLFLTLSQPQPHPHHHHHDRIVQEVLRDCVRKPGPSLQTHKNPKSPTPGFASSSSSSASLPQSSQLKPQPTAHKPGGNHASLPTGTCPRSGIVAQVLASLLLGTALKDDCLTSPPLPSFHPSLPTPAHHRPRHCQGARIDQSIEAMRDYRVRQRQVFVGFLGWWFVRGYE